MPFASGPIDHASRVEDDDSSGRTRRRSIIKESQWLTRKEPINLNAVAVMTRAGEVHAERAIAAAKDVPGCAGAPAAAVARFAASAPTRISRWITKMSGPCPALSPRAGKSSPAALRAIAPGISANWQWQSNG